MKYVILLLILLGLRKHAIVQDTNSMHSDKVNLGLAEYLIRRNWVKIDDTNCNYTFNISTLYDQHYWVKGNQYIKDTLNYIIGYRADTISPLPIGAGLLKNWYGYYIQTYYEVSDFDGFSCIPIYSVGNKY